MSHIQLQNLINNLQKLIEDDPAMADQAVLYQYITKEAWEGRNLQTISDGQWFDMVQRANDDFADSATELAWDYLCYPDDEEGES